MADKKETTQKNITSKNASGDAKKKKKEKQSENGSEDISEPSTSGVVPSSFGINPAMQLQNLMKTLGLHRNVPHEFQFWNTQPVPNMDENISKEVNECVESDKKISEIQQDPYNLPPGFSWSTLNLNDSKELESLYTLLNENYVEDDDNMFRFDYRKEFLRWALMPPGYRKEWHVGVRVTKTGRLMGFISAIPAEIRIYEKTKKVVEINFLCVHKRLRSKRLAPVLIKEVTRRVNLTGVFQATYTAGVVLPKPVASCRYWHRSLNPKKLIDIKFSQLGANMTMQRTLKLFKLPEDTYTKGFRKVEEKDMKKCHKLLTEYLQRFDLAPCFSLDDFKHWFTPMEDVVNSYLIETDGKITDFVSFYTLPSTVVNHPVHKTLKAAYSFYNVSTSTPLKTMMKDALISAKKEDYDVFNALDLMDNDQFLEDLRFGQGDGKLQYYLYNWRCPEMTPNRVGLVLQ